MTRANPFLLCLVAATLAQGSERSLTSSEPYVSPAPRVTVSTLDVFVVDATKVSSVDVPLWGPAAVLAAWPIGVDLPETGLRMTDRSGRPLAPEGRAEEAFLQGVPDELPGLMDLPPTRSVLRRAPAARGLYRLDLTRARTGAKAFAVAVQDASGIELHSSLTRALYLAGDRPVLTASFRQGQGLKRLPGAILEAQVPSADGRVLAVPLRDDGVSPDARAGDGLYSAHLSPGTGALTQVRIVARTTADGLPMGRVGHAAFATASGEARILSQPAAGRSDPGPASTVPVQVFVGHGGAFRLQGTLVCRDAAGRWTRAGFLEATQTVAKAGRYTFELALDGAVSEGSGPYQLRDVAILDLDRFRVADEAAVLEVPQIFSPPAPGPMSRVAPAHVKAR